MAILTFDPTSSVTSNQFRYFEEILRRGSQYGAIESFGGTLYNGQEYASYSGSFQSRISGFMDLSVPLDRPSVSLASFFDSPARIKESTTWVFSAKAEFLSLSYFELFDEQTRAAIGHTYEGDVFRLGAGSDYFRISIGFWGDAGSSIYSDAEDEALDDGYQFTIEGGDGADRIKVSYANDSDYACDKIVEGIWTQAVVVPCVRISGGAGNDRAAVSRIAGMLNGDGGADILSGTVFSDWISGGAGNDVINGHSEGLDEDEFVAGMYNLFLEQKDLLSGGQGKDTFLIGSVDSYGFNGSSDFFVITDFDRTDRIASPFRRGDLLIDGTDGTLALAATSAYGAQTLKYTARVLLDSDDSGKLSTGDELLGYICGFQPTPAHLVYGI